MDSRVTHLLAELEADTSTEVAMGFAGLVAAYFADTRVGDGRVSTAWTPAALGARFDEPLPLAGRPVGEVLARLERDVIADSNRLMHPRSMGHQVSAPLAAAVWAESLTAALNQSGAVWEMSPVGTVIETQVVRWMCGLAGFGPGAGGTFTSGGTEANFAGLLAARQAALPEAWARGVGPNPPVVVCGEHAHYGVARAVGELGLGTDRIVPVPSREFRMDVPALEQTLDRLARERRAIMAVVATAGTTATGSFDDLDAIGRLCEERGLWLHVDGAHGASALFSPTRRAHLAGLNRARSLAWDPHKMMLIPLTASVVLVRDEADLGGGVLAARAVPLPRRRRRTELGPGHPQFLVFATDRRVQGVGRHPAPRSGRVRRALRSSLRRGDDAVRDAAGAAGLRHAARSRRRTSSASATSGTGRGTTTRWTRSISRFARATTAAATAGLRPPSSAAAACCASR